MKFHSIEMEGKLVIQKVSSKPTWRSEDKGRIIYVEDEKMLYYASDEMWLKSAGAGFNPRYIEEDYTAEVQDLLLVDTSNGPITITFPPEPKDGGEIKIVDAMGIFESNPCTLHRNGKKMQGHEKNLVLDINEGITTATFDKRYGWKFSLGGLNQIVGQATIFVNKHTQMAGAIDGFGGQKEFNLPFKYNTAKDNISVYVQGVFQSDFEKTNTSAITLNESVPSGTIVTVVSVPIEGGFNIDKFATVNDLEDRVHISAFTDIHILEMLSTVDGIDSGLDADLLDGRQGNSFVYVENYEDLDVLSKIRNVDGHTSGLDADMIDTFHASNDIANRNNRIPVARADGTLDPLWIPFGRGSIEYVSSWEITASTPVIEIDVDNLAGNIVVLRNVVPSDDNVEFWLRVYNTTAGSWQTLHSWSSHYSTHLAGPLRDFNTNTDMLLGRGVGNGMFGLNGNLLLIGFSDTVGTLTKTIQSDISFLSSVGSYASRYSGVGALLNDGNAYNKIRMYFNNGTIEKGTINVLKINDTAE